MEKLLEALKNKDEFSALMIYNVLINNGTSHDEIMQVLKEHGYVKEEK